MAIIISPSPKIESLLDPRYAQVGDEVEVTFVNDLPTITLPYAKTTQPPYSCRALVNTTGVTNLSGAWSGCTSIVEFPLLEFDDCLNFEGAWEGCAALTTFPAHAFDNCQCSNYTNAFSGCSLSRTSVDNILVSINNSGVTGGTIDIDGVGNGGPTSVGRAALAQLQAKGWTVNVNRVCDQPPYNCSTDVDPYCVTNFNDAWMNCTSITTFPLIDTSSGTHFHRAWYGCSSLANFPLINISNAESIFATWSYCSGLTSFPMLNTSKVTYFASAWQGCQNLSTFPLIDTSKGYDFTAAWSNCTNLTSFPLLDTSKGQSFSNAWSNCTKLTSFPAINTYLGINFANAWSLCIGLTSFPVIDTSNGTSFWSAWAGCNSLTSFPKLEFSSAVLFSLSSFTWSGTWSGCSSLVDFPANTFDNCPATEFGAAWYNCALSQQSVDNILISIDTAGQSNGILGISGGTSSTPSLAGWAAVISLEQKGWTVSVNGTKPCFQPPYNCSTKVNPSCVVNLDYAWYNCTSITNFPLINVSSGVNFQGAWWGCTNMTSFAALNTSSGVNFRYAWQYCSSLTTFPLINTSNGTNFTQSWFYCSSLTSFPALNTSKGTSFIGSWTGCYNLTSFPLLNLGLGTNFSQAWQYCVSLVVFPPNMFDTCLATNFTGSWSGCALSQQSVDNILISIDTAGQLDGTLGINGGTSSTPSTLGWAAYDSLVNKGWTVTVNGSHPLAPWPPVGCNPWVDSSGVTNFDYVWQNCPLKSFPLIDTSSGIRFEASWSNTQLRSFPSLNTSSGKYFFASWNSCHSLTSFPVIDTSSGIDFAATWAGCTSLTSFPSLNFSSALQFNFAWGLCQNLTTFPSGVFDNCPSNAFFQAWSGCALSQQSVDNIIVSIDKAGQSNGTLSIDGGTSSPPSLVGWYSVASLQAKGWTVSVNGTPPAAWPPTSCNTNVQTYGVTSFYQAWKNCSSLTSFPIMNTSNVTNFTAAWTVCTSLTSFPQLNVSSGTYFNGAWAVCSNLTSFPSLNFNSGTNFYGCWWDCTSLTSFPAGVFDSCLANNFFSAWRNCALSQQSVDNILVSINASGISNGGLDIVGGTSSPPSPIGLAAKASLVSRGWTVTTN